jgi:hypothetical protein
MQDGAHFTATQLVRAGISYNYLQSRSVFVFTLYYKAKIAVCSEGNTELINTM